MQKDKITANGFTLIEVLIALSVLGLGIAGAAKITEMGYLQVAAAENYRRAATLADSHLNTLHGTINLDAPYQTGRYDEHFRWELWLVPVSYEDVFPPDKNLQLSSSRLRLTPPGRLTDKVVARRADLKLWFEEDTRSLDFHTLILSEVSK
ncbi:MAG: prepilin-type N-terminal cleavage/methylation domain-containing protein [Gammaproteobacteria bacterium]|nr:prepilin-type N-terminal cleavage/methylation domain-containing protein [Gammaproteobacteria bacterium]